MITAADDLYLKNKVHLFWSTAINYGDFILACGRMTDDAHRANVFFPSNCRCKFGDMRLDLDTVITALYMTQLKIVMCAGKLQNLFGANVGTTGWWCHEIKSHRHAVKSKQYAGWEFSQMLLAMSEDVRVLLVNYRTHNMRTINYIPKDEKRERIIETLSTRLLQSVSDLEFAAWSWK